MSLIPGGMVPHSGTATFYTATEFDLPSSDNYTDVTWSTDGLTAYILGDGGFISRVYEYITPIAYRVQALTEDGSVTLSPSIGGSSGFNRGLCQNGSFFFAMREDGTGEAGPHFIERLSLSGTASQKLEITIDTSQLATVRMNTAGTRIFYQDDNVLYWHDLGTARDLTTAGSASSQSFADFTQSRAFSFNTNGTKLFIASAEAFNRVIWEYSLSTAFDPSTKGTGIERDYSGTVTGTIEGITIDSSGDALVVNDARKLAKVEI